MKIRIKRISPYQAGKMLAAIYALLSVLVVPLLLIVALVSPKGSGGMSLATVFILPLIYIVSGMIGGIIGAFIYNLVAGWVGGIEMEFNEE